MSDASRYLNHDPPRWTRCPVCLQPLVSYRIVDTAEIPALDDEGQPDPMRKPDQEESLIGHFQPCGHSSFIVPHDPAYVTEWRPRAEEAPPPRLDWRTEL